MTKKKTAGNKRRSERRITATSYIAQSPTAVRLLCWLKSTGVAVGDTVAALCFDLLRYSGRLSSPGAQRFVRRAMPQAERCYHELAAHTSGSDAKEPLLGDRLWRTLAEEVGSDDVIGFVYQSLLTEGERWKHGVYYTKRSVAERLLADTTLAAGDTLLDPACGSGALLLAANTDNPLTLWGFDTDPVAVMIAGTNLLVKYPHTDFTPNIFCLNFLSCLPTPASCLLPPDSLLLPPPSCLPTPVSCLLPPPFSHIFTNPPWGTLRDTPDEQPLSTPSMGSITSRERASLFIAATIDLLQPGGTMGFVLPTALLTARSHNDVRRLLLAETRIEKIDMLSDRFDGVYTGFFTIKARKEKTHGQCYSVTSNGSTTTIRPTATDTQRATLPTRQLPEVLLSVVKKMEQARHDSLSHSLWALGIVTGNNRRLLHARQRTGMEPIVRGRQITPFAIEKSNVFVRFSPKEFQQCAKEQLYRAEEKLIYRFVARFPVVAYDNSGLLCLNSANILIPRVEGLSVKSVCALLNSRLYRFYYSTLCSDVKVLKSTLSRLPFPLLSREQDVLLSTFTDKIIGEPHNTRLTAELDSTVYDFFGITSPEREAIEALLTP